MAKKAKIERRAKLAESLQIEEADIQVIRDTRSAWLRILDHITEKGIYAIILFVPLAFLPDTHWLFDLTRAGILRMLTLLVLAAYLCRLAIAREWRIVLPPRLVLWPILAYVAIYAISTIFSISPNLSLYSGEGRNFGLISLVNMIILYFLVINVMTDRKRLMRCLTLFVASASAIVLLGFYQFYGHLDPEGLGLGIKESHLKIVLGMAVCVAIAFFYLAVFHTRAGAEKRVWCAVVFAVALAIVFSLAFDLSKDTNAFKPSDDQSILYAQTYKDGEPTGVYTNYDFVWEKCDPDDPKSGDVARLDGIHQMAPMMAHRTSSTFGNPDFLIPFLLLIIPIAYAFVLRRLWGYAVPLLLFGLCLCMSLPYQEFGEYWVLFLVGAGILLIPIVAMFIRIVHKYAPHYFLLIVFIAAVCILSFNMFDVRDKSVDFAENHIGLGEDDDRTYLRGIAGRTLDSPQNWIIGSGPNTFRDTFTQHVTLEYSQEKPDRREDKVHNSFVESFATTGILGIGTYAVMLVSLAIYFALWLLRNRGKRRFIYVGMILAAVLLYIPQSLSIFHTVVPYTFFWIVAAIGVGLTVVDNPPARTIDLNISKVFSYCLVGVFLAVSVYGGYLAARPVIADHYYQEGLRAGNCGDIASEVKWYKKAHEWNGYELHYNLDYAYALLKQAVSGSVSGDDDVVEQNCAEVLDVMTDAVNNEPDSAMVYFNRAQMMNGCGYDRGTVLQDVLTTIELYPNGYLGYWFAAELFTEAGDLGNAVLFDEAAFEIVPKYLGGKMQTSVSNYTEALVRFGRNQMALGLQYEADGDFDGAQEQFENAVSSLEQVIGMDPNDPGARFFLGRAYEESGELEEAHSEYKEAIAILKEIAEARPDDDAVHYYLGAAYEGLGELDKAEEEYKTALGINPEFQEAKNGLERVQEKRAEVDGL